MVQIRAIIADDEEPIRVYIKAKLSILWPEMIICGEARNGLEALELIENHGPQIAFLDIQMPGLSGLDVARQVAGKCRLVFITAHDQYAVEAFDNEAVDYLLKPITDDRLKKAVERLKKRLNNPFQGPEEIQKTMQMMLQAFEKSGKSYLRWIKAQHGDGVIIIPVDDVCYFSKSEKYTRMVTKKKDFLIHKTIQTLEEELDPHEFWRIHRGMIVNARHIEKVSRSITGRGIIRLKERPETLIVSRNYLHIFKQM